MAFVLILFYIFFKWWFVDKYDQIKILRAIVDRHKDPFHTNPIPAVLTTVDLLLQQ